MRFFYSKTSIKYLQTFEQKVAHKIVKAIEKLPSEGDIKRFKGTRIKNVYRLRIGKFRVIFSLEKDVIDVIKVIKIDTRGDVYK